MAKQTLPYPPGFVEPTTGRVAVLVREYADSDLNGDAPAYWYSAQSEEWGLDPWRLVEGVDPHVGGGSFDVCFASGGTRTVGPLMTFFLSAAHAAQLIDAKGKSWPCSAPPWPSSRTGWACLPRRCASRRRWRAGRPCSTTRTGPRFARARWIPTTGDRRGRRPQRHRPSTRREQIFSR